MQRGDKIFIKDYKCNSDGTTSEILRPAEIVWQPGENDELIMVKLLDEKFRKGGRALHSIQILRSNIVMKEKVVWNSKIMCH